jgi:hypothetical protein
MLLVRTDTKAVLAGAIIMALVTLEVIRTGLVMTAQDRASLDAWVVLAVATGVIYGGLFLCGHHALRRRGQRSRGAYAALGAAAALPPFLLATGWRSIAAAGNTGMLSALLICPLAGGALMGFLYHRRAGYDIAGDDVEALAAAAGEASTPSHLATETAEYFDGPLVVRSSLGANVLASMLGGATFVLASTLSAVADPFSSPLMAFLTHNGAGRTLLQGIIGLAILIAPVLALTHAVLRSRRKHGYGDYALAGVIGPLVFSILMSMTGMSWFAFVYLLEFLAPSLVAMLAYRRLAGIEPAPLPEDIEVSDRRTLVDANHVRRRMARVIDTAAR